MKFKVLKLNKDSLLIEKTIQTGILDNNVVATISVANYDGSMESGENLLPFTISVSKKTIPNFEDEEFCIVIREKFNFAEQHVNYQKAKNTGLDNGGTDKKSRPLKPKQENNLFIELKGEND